MPVIVIETDDLERWIRETVAASVKDYVTSQLPPILNKQQFMEMLDIGATKAAELLNRPGFPVIRDFGNPRVPTHLLMQWIEEHTDWVSKNTGDNFKSKRRHATG